MSDVRIKQIKIKTGVVKRLAKEKAMYEKEAELQRLKVEKMKEEGKDEYEIKKQEEVLQESVMMVPDCRKRLFAAHADLKNIIESESDLAENEDYQSAQTILQEAEESLK